jgi:NET1-associated nuclear protein 1 (U3 small nucleolar RNA-associated protein 17)
MLKEAVLGMQFSHDGQYFAAATPAQLYVVSTKDFHSGWVRFNPPDRLTCLAVHPTGPLLATGDSKGMIRIYHPFDDMWWARRAALQETTGLKQTVKGEPAVSSLHWHPHPVGAIAFTPGGYMVSGGEESVLVIWHPETGRKDFFPLREVPISALSPAPQDSDTPNDVAITLNDGTLRFVDRALMEVRRAVYSIKVPPLDRDSKDRPAPLTLLPGTDNLLLTSSHPSSLQVYSLSQGVNLAEVEVASSNRVANRRGAAPLEPIRVRDVAASNKQADGSSWLATYQTWQAEGFRPEAVLKFFKASVSDSRCAS